MDSDSDEDDFVVLGTPLEPLAEDDELPTKKPIHEQTVHDDKGRRRFHGAFSGGFSAGYFNSVGSKEGWAPSSFISSRSQKAEKTQKNPEDFMDDEDLGAFGIAPRKVQILDRFHDTDKDSNRKRSLPITSDGPIPGEPLLRELVKPVSASIGVKILQQMGWRPGQGIGPREKRKQKSIIKVYGCAPPSSPHVSEDDDEDDPYAAQHMFAPKDQEMLPYTPKDNLFGIGYSGLSKDPILSVHINLFEPTHTSAILGKKKKLTISGEAFGVGAFEEEDADIYAKDDMTQYDFALEESGQNQDSNSKPSRSKTLGYVQKVLEGFHLSSKPALKKPKYPPPSLPSNFKPVHQRSKALQQFATNSVQETKRFLDRHQMSSQDRTAVLEGQTPISKKGAVSSVFDLLAPEDKLKLQKIQKFKEETTLPHSPLQDVQKLSSSFKPFQSDPEKQARYEKYQTLIKMGKTDCLDSVHPYTMTEWERQREKEEFQRAVMLYRPLSASLSSRFISSSQLDNDREVEIRVDQDGDKTDQKKAAELKMYGKLTREKFEWHPAQLLCKRFNIPNPYPDCKMVGLPKVKRDKYSIFNFLTVPSDIEPNKKAETYDHSTPPIPAEHIKKEIEEVEVNQETKVENEEASIATDGSNPMLQVDAESRTSKPSMDLFKAIFQNTSSEDSNSSDEETSHQQLPTELNDQTPQKSEENVQLSKHEPENFPPAFGVFANIDLDALNNERELPPENVNTFNNSDSSRNFPSSISGENNITSSLSIPTNEQTVEDFYGPKLPPSTSDDCIYIGEKQTSAKESGSHSHRKHKKHKHHKHKEEKSKSKKEKHRSKHKHKKSSCLLKERRPSSEESSDSDANTDVKILERLHQLKRRAYDI